MPNVLACRSIGKSQTSTIHHRVSASSPSTLPTRCSPLWSLAVATQAVAMLVPIVVNPRSSRLITQQLATWNLETSRHNIPAQLDPYRF
ncbi:hypothetical protein [Chamaesiphon sp. OTE_20_metabat_361]|uniref:hypothetical protein n=1 Tax=Chamaesiphon sp. OTE_20_metabat_361 TaxID=2964689 RepID=UPI00286CC4A0|nr:hypothetical protein [Chamaesiphon sp. OTE_20_metabat_361]